MRQTVAGKPPRIRDQSDRSPCSRRREERYAADHESPEIICRLPWPSSITPSGIFSSRHALNLAHVMDAYEAENDVVHFALVRRKPWMCADDAFHPPLKSGPDPTLTAPMAIIPASVAISM
jgi:hypothetical protein